MKCELIIVFNLNWFYLFLDESLLKTVDDSLELDGCKGSL